MFITTCNLQRKSLGGRLCSRGRRWSRQPRSPTVPRADPAPSASPACTGGPMGALPGLGTEPITSPALRPPPARLGSHLCPRTPRSPPVHWPQQPGPRAGGRRDAGGRALPWRPRELPCPPMIARPRRWMVTPGVALTHGDGASRTRALRAGQQLPAGAPRPPRLTRLGAITAPLAAGGRQGRAKPVPADHPPPGRPWRDRESVAGTWRRGSETAAQRQGWL